MSSEADNHEPTISGWRKISYSDRSSEPLNKIIYCMQQTNFHQWGFLIYRCTYGDDAAWTRYLEHMKQEILKNLEYCGRDLLLPKYLEWTIIEDRETLDGASKADVRTRFSEWSSPRRSAEGNSPGAWREHVLAPWRFPPRFNFCLYVDRKCLDTLKAYEAWVDGDKQGQVLVPSVVCVIIDEDCDPAGEGADGYPEIEGCTRYYPGWMYAGVRSIPTLYEKLCMGELTDGFKTYARPPLIYPRHNRGMSMPL